MIAAFAAPAAPAALSPTLVSLRGTKGRQSNFINHVNEITHRKTEVDKEDTLQGCDQTCELEDLPKKSHCYLGPMPV